MVKIQQEVITKRYRDNGIYIETKIQLSYDSEGQQIAHSKRMQENGFRVNDCDILTVNYYKKEFIPI